MHNSKTFFILINLFFFTGTILAMNDCGLTIPQDIRLMRLRYGHYAPYDHKFNKISKNDPLFEQLFKLSIARSNNISGSIIKFKKGNKQVYRSAILSENLALLSELVRERGVKTILVLTNSRILDIVPLIEKERSAFSILGGTLFIHILDFDSHIDINNIEEVQYTYARIASIIKLIDNSDGNVLIHCLGGEHKTEMVFEVMQKCINKLYIDNIIERYKCHTGWKNENICGGYREDNLKFITGFSCDLIKGM